MKEQYAKGIEGEQMAVRHLKAMGAEVLHTRYRADGGEIDIVARENGIVCFIEVKYRPGARLGEALEAVDDGKRRRILQAARAYRAAFRVTAPIRFDMMEITRAGIWHVRGEVIR